MQHIKLDAIDSTNDFLKKLAGSQNLDNYTVVTAESQTKGRGQMGAVWNSEPGKNLTMSVLITGLVADVDYLFDLNVTVAIAVYKVLERVPVPQLTVKWPNDIMSGHKKIGGVLIENSIKSDGSIQSIIGLGLNVNQVDFKNLPNAASLAVVCKRNFDKQELMESIVQNLKELAGKLNADRESFLKMYTDRLFRKGQPTAFETELGARFMGIIVGVGADGLLHVQKEDDSIQHFSLKQIKMLY